MTDPMFARRTQQEALEARFGLRIASALHESGLQHDFEQRLRRDGRTGSPCEKKWQRVSYTEALQCMSSRCCCYMAVITLHVTAQSPS